ncbi:MAG: hypothetical protein U0R78_03215 [Nocardioidaceae bacterium]
MRPSLPTAARTRLGVGAAALVATAGLLTSCGSSDATAAASDTTTSGGASAAQPSGAPGDGGAGGMDEAQLTKIRACLKAAGLEDELPSAMPSDRPSDMPTDMPSDMAGGGPGGFLSEEAQAALAACGIELPSPPSGSAG